MPVNIDRHVDRTVAHLLFHIRQAFTILEQERCKAVAQAWNLTRLSLASVKSRLNTLRRLLGSTWVDAGLWNSQPSMTSFTTVAASLRSSAGFSISLRNASARRCDIISFSTSANCVDISTLRALPFSVALIFPRDRFRCTQIKRPLKSMSVALAIPVRPGGCLFSVRTRKAGTSEHISCPERFSA